MGKLDGKVAVITGASKGIGEGIAKVYAGYGAKCVLAARGSKVLELAEELKKDGYEAFVRDWERSGIGKSLEFAQLVNKQGKVLNLPPKMQMIHA